MIKLPSSDYKSRIILLLHFFFIVLVIILFRIFALQIVNNNYYRKLAEKNIIKVETLAQNRGEFLDRNGKLLAGNIPDYILEVYPYLLEDKEEAIRFLARVSQTNEKEIEKKLNAAKSLYKPVFLKRHLSQREISRIVESFTNMPGISVVRKPMRQYKYAKMTSLVLGFTGEVTESELANEKNLKEGDIVGKCGLEKEYERYLRGTAGVQYIEVDAKGREIGIFNQIQSRQPEPGDEIRLTIDIDLQKTADSLLSDYSNASVVAINPLNGDVLVLFSKPDFDPNLLIRGISSEGLKTIMLTQNSSFWNRATMSIYPPGSVFKIIVAAIGLETKLLKPTTVMNPCRGILRIGNKNYFCWKKHGLLNTYDAIVQSCDIFFYQTGLKIGFSNLNKGIRKLGFFRKTNIDLPEEKAGFFPDEHWYKNRFNINSPTRGMIANLSIGQGEVLVTPLEVCSFFAGIANNGYIIEPHLVDEIRDIHGNTRLIPKTKSRKIPLSQENIKFLKNAMLGVVNDKKGTGILAKLSNIRVAGKTGTAENPHGNDHAWFVGFAPFEKPEICVVVMVENAGHGGAVAAPIAREIIRKALIPLRETQKKVMPKQPQRDNP